MGASNEGRTQSIWKKSGMDSNRMTKRLLCYWNQVGISKLTRWKWKSYSKQNMVRCSRRLTTRRYWLRWNLCTCGKVIIYSKFTFWFPFQASYTISNGCEKCFFKRFYKRRSFQPPGFENPSCSNFFINFPMLYSDLNKLEKLCMKDWVRCYCKNN